ncbi:MEMBRANE-ASSOCIATED KINASE REGULATOR 3-RELATED [Salix koriyanagi]|uniref:MEMBRANE-ASSOCIATED KINASE REGULATOR 3-RELATED n=1 Tax=Salix koriyanagi TaxID=2511006 RepID=A0A9Q0WU31_9ROSI|nr:MEMBRANE-ASSOCIATED KINASE REGULATOR 3-RELATED [Salix koriyanagi]
MAMNQHLSYEHDDDDDDYIDLEVSSYSNFLCHSISSSPFPMEFEFQMSTVPPEKDTTTSPADELFYKGKLLPLHLPPRLQMVEKILGKIQLWI